MISFQQETKRHLAEVNDIMDPLQHQAQTLTDQTDKASEKEHIVAIMASLQQQVAEQSHEADTKSAELAEATQPWEEYHEALDQVKDWMDNCAPVLVPELVMTNPNVVRQELDEHKVK